jgi:putative MATE family efflux protein
MLRLALPGILGMSVASINVFMDALFVGQWVGENAVAAISLAFPLLMLIGGFAAMIGQGSASVLSRALGADDRDRQSVILSNLTALCLLVGLGISLPGFFFARELIALLGGTGEILDLGETYLQVMMLAAFPRIYAVSVNVIIRAEGNLKAAMTYSAASAVLNILLNALFIGPLGWGIAGAAWASLFAMLFMALLNLLYFIRGKSSFPVSLTRIYFAPLVLKEVLFIGVSAMMLQVMFFLQQVAVFRSIAHYGEDADIAFMGASYRIYLLATIPIFGFAQALQPVIGINFGARLYERVRRAMGIFTFTGTAVICLIWLGFAFFSEPILGALLPDTVFSQADLFRFRILMLVLPFQPIFFTGITLFQATGNGRMAGGLLIGRMLLVFIPLVMLLPLLFQLDGIYYAHPLSDLLAAATMGFFAWRSLKRM